MASKNTISEDKKYIIQKITGVINRKLSMEYNIESHILGKEVGINRYLVDITEAINQESSFEQYEFAYDDMKKQSVIDRSARVAVLVHPDDHSHDFIETVAKNSGLDVTIFRDRNQAVEHLLKE